MNTALFLKQALIWAQGMGIPENVVAGGLYFTVPLSTCYGSELQEIATVEC